MTFLFYNFFFFFFNDTATTEIYTLSLHDALPIYIASNNIITGEYDGSSNHTDGNGIILDLGSNTPPALIINNVVYGNGDRKSTRLNSSHSQISYAVFCLKKKKNKKHIQYNN